MASWVVNVLVVNKKTKKGVSGQYVNLYNKPKVKTDKDGKATLVSSDSSVDVYCKGSSFYSGSVSSAPDPIVIEIS